MSRIGIKPVAVLDGVKVFIEGQTVKVEGPLGKLEFSHRPEVSVALSERQTTRCGAAIRRSGCESVSRFDPFTHPKHGRRCENRLQRLEVVGVGYVCSLQGKTLSLRVGFANEIKKTVP